MDIREKQAADDRYYTEMQRRAAERAHDSADAEHGKVNEAAVSTGLFTVRSILLINGGAAAALLAFIGSLIGEGKVEAQSVLIDVASSLMWFVWGVVCAGIAAAAAYLVNYFTSEQYASRSKHWEHPYVRDTDATRRWWRARATAHGAAFLGGLLGLVFFVYGMLDMKQSISRLPIKAPSTQNQTGETPK